MSFSCFISKITESLLGTILLWCLGGIALVLMFYQTIKSIIHKILYDGRTIFVSLVLLIIFSHCMTDSAWDVFNIQKWASWTLYALFILCTLITPFWLFYSIIRKQIRIIDSGHHTSNVTDDYSWLKYYENDDAIESMEEDKLSFEHHLNALMDSIITIKDKGTHSIAITGGWGTGKTSFLHLLQHELLNQKQQYEVVWFDPLQSSKSDNIQSDFFDVLEKALSKYKHGFGRRIKYYKELIGAIDNKYISFLIKLGNIQLQDEKKRINDVIGLIKKKIFIIIDDVDRLKEDEIIQIFRLVKFNAKFDNVIFILAIDKRNVITTLKCDEKFPNKFFELEFPLPDLGRNFIANQIKDTITGQFKRSMVSFLDDPKMIEYTEYCIDTLRDAKRFNNFFTRRVEIIKYKLDITSYYVLSLIHYKIPTLYEQLHSKQLLNQDFTLKESIGESLESIGIKDSTIIIDMLQTLFPSQNTPTSTISPINQQEYFEDYFTEASTKIVTTKQMLDLLFVPDDKVDNLINALNEYKQNAIRKASTRAFWEKRVKEGDIYPILSKSLDLENLSRQDRKKYGEHLKLLIKNYYRILKCLGIENHLEYSEEENLAPCVYNKKWGYIDQNFNLKIPFEYDEAAPFSEGFACVKKYGKYRFIDKNNTDVFKQRFNDAQSFSSDKKAHVKKNKKWGYINKNGAFQLEN
jgi:DNA polymerase III delta prime subunit